MHLIFYIHSWVVGHLGWFHALAIENNAAVNIEVHVSFWIMVFSCIIATPCTIRSMDFAIPWTSPGQNTRVGGCSLLQGIFLIQGSKTGLLHCRQILYQLSHQGSPRILEWVTYPFSRGIFLTQELNQGLLHCRWILYQLSYQGIPYVNAYMCNLEKWYRWTYFQGKNGDADAHKGHVDTDGKWQNGVNWEVWIDVYTLPCGKQMASWEPAIKHSKINLVLYDDLGVWDGDGLEGGPRGRGYMYTYNWFTSLYNRNTTL